MPEIKSPLGTKQIKGQPLKDLTIPDETGAMPPTHQHRQFDQQTPHFDPQAMRDFESSLAGGRPVQQMREMSDVERQILEQKKLKREGKERLSEGARRRIEMLIGMTRLTKDIDIDGQQYRLQILKSKELRDALVSTSEFDGTLQLIFETRKQLLARSLVIVAGVDIENFLNSDELRDRLDFIEEMPHELLLRLYNEYLTLADEAQSKYALKTVAEVKEVVDDLKKA